MIVELVLTKQSTIILLTDRKQKFSVTEIIDKFFPEFDSAYWAERKAIEKLNQDHVEYDSEVLQATIKQY